MDYGQNPQLANSESNQDFFTAGAGTNSESVNDFESENNLDLTNQLTDWGQTTAIAQHQSLGNRAISSSETSENNGESSTELGEVVNLEMPPSSRSAVQAQADLVASQSSTPFVRGNIRTTEKLESSGIKEVDHIIGKLNQDGNAASFYDLARDMMKANMENSYGEKATWKEVA